MDERSMAGTGNEVGRETRETDDGRQTYRDRQTDTE